MPRFRRLPIFLPPAIAGLVSAAVMLGPGRERLVHGARVYGWPTSDASVLALRVRSVAHFGGRARQAPEQAIELKLHLPSGRSEGWSGDSDDAGIADALMQPSQGLREGVELELRVGDASPLRKVLALQRAPELAERPKAAEDDPAGNAVQLHLPRQQLVAEFPEPLVALVRLRAGHGQPVLRWTLGGGAVRGGAAPLELGCEAGSCRYRYEFTLTAKAPTLSLELVIDQQPQLLWRGDWPVLLGRMWLEPAIDPASRTRRIGAAIPKDEAYVSLMGLGGRLWGTRVALQPDQQSFSWGMLELPELPDGPLALQLASEPGEGEGSSISWPLRAELGAFVQQPLALLLDTLPPAIAAEQQRRARARSASYVASSAALLLLIAQLVTATRRQRSGLPAHGPAAWVVALIAAGLGLLLWLVAASSGHGG